MPAPGGPIATTVPGDYGAEMIKIGPSGSGALNVINEKPKKASAQLKPLSTASCVN